MKEPEDSSDSFTKVHIFLLLLFLLAKQTEAFLLVFVLFSFARTGLGGKCDDERQRLCSTRRRCARFTALHLGTVLGTSIQDSLNPGAHLILQRATEWQKGLKVVKGTSIQCIELL